MMKTRTVAFLFILLAVAIAVHQYVFWGVAFELEDIHHETFVIAFLCAGVSLYYFNLARRQGL